MARFKNALVEHFIGEVGAEEASLHQLANYITTIEDDSEEDVEEVAYYSGDGTPEQDVITYKESYTVEGFFDPEDLAHKLVADKKRKLGDDRKVQYKQKHPDGAVINGIATLTEIKVGGGEASAYAPISFKVSYDTVPEVTNTPEV